MEPLAVSVAEAARLLSVSKRTISRWIRSGRIPAIRLSRRVLVPLDSLKKLLQS
jgi:excisionase family DNA binding protein